VLNLINEHGAVFYKIDLTTGKAGVSAWTLRT
jgi:hypothetical protein